jgi:3-deoxy-D-manno-octulosonic acid kinase
MTLERVATAVAGGTGAILYDPSRFSQPSTTAFDPAYWQRHGALQATAVGRGSSWFVTTPQGARWVLRHYRRGGLIGRCVEDRYWWPGEDKVRSFSELRLLETLEALKLPAPRPVAAHYERIGRTYRADLITIEIEGVRPLSQLAPGDLGPAAWREIGRAIRRFHDAGVCHADLNAHNILVDASGQVSLVDFDRGSLRPPGAWRQGNLARLVRSLRKLAASNAALSGATQWQTLLSGYDAGPPPRILPPR